MTAATNDLRDDRVRVLIIDDEPEDRTTLSRILRSEPRIDIVGEASDGDEAMSLVAARTPDVVLMDVRMHRVDGIAATRMIRSVPTPPDVLILSAFDVGESVIGAVQAGAAGFLLKSDPPRQMIASVLAVVDGDVAYSQSALRHLTEQVRASADTAARTAATRKLDTLSPRERDIVESAAAGLSNAEIGAHLHVSTSTVKTALSRAYLKLDVSNRTSATLIVHQAGTCVRDGNASPSSLRPSPQVR